MQARELLPPKPPRPPKTQRWTFGPTDIVSIYGVDCTCFANTKAVHLHTLAMDVGLWHSLTPEMQQKAEKVRVWMGAAMCCTTRCITGLTIAPTANSQSVRMLLRMSLTDKSAMARAVGAQTP
jgi:hypothetical protein